MCPLANSLLAIRSHLCVDLTTAELLRSRLSLSQILKNIELISELDFNGRIQIKSNIFSYIFEQLRRPLFGLLRPDTSAPKKIQSEHSRHLVQQAVDRNDLVHQKTEKDFDHLAFSTRRQQISQGEYELPKRCPPKNRLFIRMTKSGQIFCCGGGMQYEVDSHFIVKR